MYLDINPQELFDLLHAVLSAEYGEPRTSDKGGVDRQYFELGDGMVVMLAKEHEDGINSTP